MTAEEIKKVIRRAFTRHMVQHVQVGRGDVRDRVDLFIDEATDELLTEFASQKDAWIKVSDGLPEIDSNCKTLSIDVQCYLSEGYIINGYYDYNMKKFIHDTNRSVVTHWKPLPTPPND